MHLKNLFRAVLEAIETLWLSRFKASTFYQSRKHLAKDTIVDPAHQLGFIIFGKFVVIIRN